MDQCLFLPAAILPARQLLLSTMIVVTAAINASGQIISPSQPDVWPGGRGVAVTVHPANSNIVVVASEAGGLFKTTNAGANWTHLDGLRPFRMSDVKYDNVNSQLLIATAKLDGRIARGGGIWRSTNGGVNWRKPATAEPAAAPACAPPVNAHGISFQPGSDSVYVGTDCGLAISRDNGATWTHVRLAPAGANPRIRAVNAQAGGIVDACGDAGFFRSTTNGNTWGQASTGIPGCTQGAPHLIAVSPLEPNVIFVTTWPNTLFESDDGGVSWTPLNPPQPTPPGPGRPAFVKTHLSADGDPTHFDIYFANAYNAARQTCTSGGPGLRCSTSWNAITIGPNEQPHDPNDMTWGATGNSPRYFLSDSGFYVTNDGGATFTVTGGGRGGYNALQLYDIAGQIFSDHTDLYFGTQDNCLWASPDRAGSWINPRCEEGFNLQMKRRPASHAQETIVGVIPGRGNFFTAPHFTNFNLWNNPPNGTGNPFIIDTGVYLQYTSIPNSSASGLSLTTNTGANWNSITQPNSTARMTIQNSLAHWPQVSGTVSNPVVYQAVSKPGTNSDGSPRYGLVRIDVNIGARTGRVTPADVSGLGSLGVYCMGDATFVCPVVWGVNPQDPNHLIAPDVTDGQMKVSRNGGATWTPDAALTALVTDSGQFPFTLPPIGNTPPGVGLQVHAISFNPDTPGHILVGTEAAGIFQSIDNGQTWSKIAFSDHFIRGMTSFFFADGGTIFVSTYGHGLWRIDPGRLPPPLCNNRPVIDCRTDLRNLAGELIFPDKKFICPRPPQIPDCQVVGVDRGIIEDLELGEKGLIKRGAISGRGLLAYNWDSKRIPLDIGGIKFSKSTRPGRFEGCPACRTVLKEGGTITGIIQEKGRVLAIISEFSKPLRLPSRPVIKPIQTGRTLPYLQLMGTIPVTGQTVAVMGDTVNVHGSGFCGSPTCSPITLRIGTRVARENVRPDDKGTFRASFSVREMSGQYLVTASQVSATKTRIEDSRLLIVPVVDKERR